MNITHKIVLLLVAVAKLALSDNRMSIDAPSNLGDLDLTKIDSHQYLSSVINFTYSSGSAQRITVVPNINTKQILIGLKEDAGGDSAGFGVECKGLEENKCEVTGDDTTTIFQGKKINVKNGQTVCPVFAGEFSSKSDVYMPVSFMVKQDKEDNKNLPYDTESGVLGIGPGSEAYKYFISAYKSSETSKTTTVTFRMLVGKEQGGGISYDQIKGNQIGFEKSVLNVELGDDKYISENTVDPIVIPNNPVSADSNNISRFAVGNAKVSSNGKDLQTGSVCFISDSTKLLFFKTNNQLAEFQNMVSQKMCKKDSCSGGDISSKNAPDLKIYFYSDSDTLPENKNVAKRLLSSSSKSLSFVIKGHQYITKQDDKIVWAVNSAQKEWDYNCDKNDSFGIGSLFFAEAYVGFKGDAFGNHFIVIGPQHAVVFPWWAKTLITLGVLILLISCCCGLCFIRRKRKRIALAKEKADYKRENNL